MLKLRRGTDKLQSHSKTGQWKSYPKKRSRRPCALVLRQPLRDRAEFGDEKNDVRLSERKQRCTRVCRSLDCRPAGTVGRKEALHQSP